MKILIIEDESQLVKDINNYLSQEGYICEVAQTVKEGEEKVSLFEYDCILLDITLPDGNGLKLLKKLKSQHKTDGVIIISAKDSLEDKITGLGLGADDYLTKPFFLPELSARIASLIRRRKFLGNNNITFQEIQIDLQAKSVQINNRPIELTKKEFDLLLFLVSNKNRVLSKNAIAEHISGDDAELLDKFDFIYSHIKNLKKKLNDAGCKDYIKTIYGLGYKFSL